jgi:hypothetical protein
MREDRRGRLTAVDREPHRRPADGFRTRDARRFRQLALTAIGSLPTPLRTAASAADIVVADLPPPAEAPALARWLPDAVGQRRTLVLYRRVIEARATSKHELLAVLRTAIGEALGEPQDGP